MTLNSILTGIKDLSFTEKLQLISFLAEDLKQPFARKEQVEAVPAILPHKVYYLHTPYNTFGAADQLMKALENRADYEI